MRVVQRQRPQSQTLQRKENRRRDLRAHIPRSDRVEGEALQKDYQDRRELRDAVFHEITALLLAEATVLVLPDDAGGAETVLQADGRQRRQAARVQHHQTDRQSSLQQLHQVIARRRQRPTDRVACIDGKLEGLADVADADGERGSVFVRNGVDLRDVEEGVVDRFGKEVKGRIVGFAVHGVEEGVACRVRHENVRLRRENLRRVLEETIQNHPDAFCKTRLRLVFLLYEQQRETRVGKSTGLRVRRRHVDAAEETRVTQVALVRRERNLRHRSHAAPRDRRRACVSNRWRRDTALACPPSERCTRINVRNRTHAN